MVTSKDSEAYKSAVRYRKRVLAWRSVHETPFHEHRLLTFKAGRLHPPTDRPISECTEEELLGPFFDVGACLRLDHPSANCSSVRFQLLGTTFVYTPRRFMSYLKNLVFHDFEYDEDSFSDTFGINLNWRIGWDSHCRSATCPG